MCQDGETMLTDKQQAILDCRKKEQFALNTSSNLEREFSLPPSSVNYQIPMPRRAV